MVITIRIHADPPPLRITDSNDIRIADSHVLLDVLIGFYKQGLTPEELVESFPSIKPADVYALAPAEDVSEAVLA
jgi:uncharacterized protein (DUF433 family)